MSTISAAARTTAVTLPTWAWLAMALALGMLYAVTFDTGFLSSPGSKVAVAWPSTRSTPFRSAPIACTPRTASSA